MNIRQQAAADLRGILEDTASGFAVDLTLTSPQGQAVQMKGLYRDIALMIDPQTGMLVSLRQASIALSIASILAAGLEVPKGIQDKSGTPWLIDIVDLQGAQQTYTIIDDVPDELGVVCYTLENFQRNPV